jgi:hypothetical protein
MCMWFTTYMQQSGSVRGCAGLHLGVCINGFCMDLTVYVCKWQQSHFPHHPPSGYTGL